MLDTGLEDKEKTECTRTLVPLQSENKGWIVKKRFVTAEL